MKHLITFALAVLLAIPAAIAQERKGPSDDQIYDQVRLRLAGDPEVNGGALEVEVKQGVVSIMGRVRTEKARQKAERLAKKVKGVRTVDNQLKIDPNAH